MGRALLMVKNAQVKLYRRLRASGKSQETAAAAAGMTAKTARKYEVDALPSARKRPRDWRTRPDPFEKVWEEEVVPLLELDDDGVLRATTILDDLKTRKPDEFHDGHLRTLQRRLRDWKALSGPEKEVYFEQVHQPGREAQWDFTHCTELGVRIAGEPLKHMYFELILSHSGRRYAELVLGGETFEALSEGIQNGFWSLGGATRFGRSDNLSAATHELKESGGRAFNRRYEEFLDHYGVRPSKIRPRKSNENGVVERGHGVFKSELAQALVLRGSRDFSSLETYKIFVAAVVGRLNDRCQERWDAEKPHLLPLPSSKVPTWTDVEAKVSKFSLIRAGSQTYSVPSRLIGHWVVARLHPDRLELRYNNVRVEIVERVRGKNAKRIDYRHVIESLVKKPGAFAQYRFKEELFPSLTFRQAYDALCGFRDERGDVDYVRILHLAAKTMESEVEAALQVLLERGTSFDYREVESLVQRPATAAAPCMLLPALTPDLSRFDELIEGGWHATPPESAAA